MKVYQGWIDAGDPVQFTIAPEYGIYAFSTSRRLSTVKFLRLWKEKYGEPFKDGWKLHMPDWAKFRPYLDYKTTREVLDVIAVDYVLGFEYIILYKLEMPLPNGGTIPLYAVHFNGFWGANTDLNEAIRQFNEEVKEAGYKIPLRGA